MELGHLKSVGKTIFIRVVFGRDSGRSQQDRGYIIGDINGVNTIFALGTGFRTTYLDVQGV